MGVAIIANKSSQPPPPPPTDRHVAATPCSNDVPEESNFNMRDPCGVSLNFRKHLKLRYMFSIPHVERGVAR